MTREQEVNYEWRMKNKERISAYNRAYYQANKEKCKESQKRWRAKNKAYYSGLYAKKRMDSTYHKVILYSVWNNFTDEVVIIDGNFTECAKAMGVSVKSFYTLVTRATKGNIKKWTIEKRLIREMEDDE